MTTIILQPLAPDVTLARYAEITGYTVKALERKIERGVWVEGREYRRDPDGARMVNIERAAAWVAKGLASRSAPTASGSRST